MKYIESQKIFELKGIPWNLLTDLSRHVQTTRNYGRVWELKEFPGFENIQDIHDKVLIRLHNQNRVMKRIKPQWKILMVLRMIREAYNDPEFDGDSLNVNNFDTFKEWYYNGEISIYRGIPCDKKLTFDKDESKWICEWDKLPDITPSNNIFKSFTLDINTATKFTDTRWAHGTFIGKDKTGRNGFILETKIKPVDIHIFNNTGYELEITPSNIENSINIIKIEGGEIL